MDERDDLADLVALPRDQWRAEIRDGVLVVSGWARGGYLHHVACRLSPPTDDQIGLDDLEGVFVDAVHVQPGGRVPFLHAGDQVDPGH